MEALRHRLDEWSSLLILLGKINRKQNALESDHGTSFCKPASNHAFASHSLGCQLARLMKEIAHLERVCSVLAERVRPVALPFGMGLFVWESQAGNEGGQ